MFYTRTRKNILFFFVSKIIWVGKKKVKAAAPKTCVKKHTLTRENRCQDIKKFFDPKGRFVTNNKTYAAAAQATLPQPAPKLAPMIDLVSSSSSEICIIDDTAKGPASVIAKTTSPAAKPCDADAPLAATTSDADARVASTSHGLVSSSTSDICVVVDATKSQNPAKATYASKAAKPCDDYAPNASTSRVSCDASAPNASTSRGSKPDEDRSKELLKNGTANTSSSPTTPSPPPSKGRRNDEDTPPLKRRRQNSSPSSTLAPSPASSSPTPSSSTATSSTPLSAPKRRRVNSSKSNIATTPASTSSTVCTATSSTPTPSSSASPSSSNGLTINTTLYEKLAEGFKMIEMGKDGACFFRSCSHQEYGTEERHQEFRDAAQQYFDANRDELEHQILALHGGTFQQFLDEQRKQETFADYFDVSAIANVYGIRIIVYRPDTRANVFNPVNGVTDPSKKPYLLAFVNNNHYNSIISINQECNADGIDYGLTGAATSLKRSDESIAMDYVTPRRTLPARRSKFAKASVIDDDNDEDSVFEADPMQSDDDYEMDDEDGSMQYDDTSVIADELSDNQPSTTMSETVNNVNEELSNASSPSPSTTGAAKKDQAKLTADKKRLEQLNEEFVKLHRRRGYYAKNNEQPQIPNRLGYKVLAMLFFHSKSKGTWWALPEITKWIKDKFLYYKNLNSTQWKESLREIMKRPSNYMFSMRGSMSTAQYSFIGTFPDVDKFIVQMSQLSASPKKSNRKTQLAHEKYARDFIHFHHYRDYYSKNDVLPTARVGGLVMYFFFSQQKHGTSWTTRDITKWMEDNIMFYTNKTNISWHNHFNIFLNSNKNVYPKTGALKNATYSFNRTFPQLEKGGTDQSQPFAQPAKSTNQMNGAANYILGSKIMKNSPKLAVEKDEDFIYFHQHRDYFATNNVKPELQYGVFVRYFFSLNEFGTWFTLKEIYTWIANNIMYYKNAKENWKNSLRTYLSTNGDTFPYRGSGYSAQYSYFRTFPEVDPNDIYEHPPFARKKLLTKFADEQIIRNWSFTDETRKEIKIPSCPHTYHISKGSSRTPDNIQYLYCVNCASKNGKRAHISGEFISKLNSTVSRLQLNDGVLRGNLEAAHLCEDEDYAEYSGREQFGIFTVEDPERFIKDVKELSEYLAQLQGETMKLKIFLFIPDPWLQPHCFRCIYLYGLGYSTDPRSFWYIGVTWNPQKRLPHHMYNERPEMFKNADGSKREVHMILLLCMPSLHQLAHELEAALISYGQHHHTLLKIAAPLTNINKGTWENGGLEKISSDPDHADFENVGNALCDLLDDGVARGPRISSFAVGTSEEMKAYKKEYRRLKSS